MFTYNRLLLTTEKLEIKIVNEQKLATSIYPPAMSLTVKKCYSSNKQNELLIILLKQENLHFLIVS